MAVQSEAVSLAHSLCAGGKSEFCFGPHMRREATDAEWDQVEESPGYELAILRNGSARLAAFVPVGCEIKAFGALGFISCDESVETGLESTQAQRLLKKLRVGEEGPHLGAILSGSPRHADIEKQRRTVLVGAL